MDRSMTEHSEFTDLALAQAEREALARAETVPSAWFTEARFDRLDREAVLGTSWQYVGHAERLARPGSWLAAEVAGEPVVVVRDLAGDLRAFFNVCRHRGGPLALADGCGRVLKCQYHGWTYLLDGSLRGVPHWNLVELFDREDYGLVPLRVDAWDGLVFVNLDQRGPSLGEVFATVSETIAPIRLGEMTFHERVVYDVKANWKVYVENYLEGYHVPIVHPELMKLYDFSSYETEISDHWSLQHSPLTEEEHIYGAGGRAYYYCVFPNFMLNILPGRLQTNLVVPTGPDRCRVEFEYFYTDTESEQARSRIEEDLEFADRVQAEDIEICEHVQRGLASRGYDRGRFSVKYEGGVYHFQNRLRRAYRDWFERDGHPEPPEPLDPRHEEVD
jgi:choline monooxygenase